MAIFRGRLSM